MNTFLPPSKRLTKEQIIDLEDLAQHLGIAIEKRTGVVVFSGLSVGEPVSVPLKVYKDRLLAEVCSAFARAIAFNFWEPCEITLFSVSIEKLRMRATALRRRAQVEERQRWRNERLAAQEVI